MAASIVRTVPCVYAAANVPRATCIVCRWPLVEQEGAHDSLDAVDQTQGGVLRAGIVFWHHLLVPRKHVESAVGRESLECFEYNPASM
jgi:hypothetical protein